MPHLEYAFPTNVATFMSYALFNDERALCEYEQV